MRDADALIFSRLCTEAIERCFGKEHGEPLSESECRLLSNAVLEQTGLMIGWKSLKNYSLFVLHRAPGKQENPSLATLDTLARYVLGAPRTDEIRRQKNENHFPYWFKYREAHRGPDLPAARTRRRNIGLGALAGGILIVVVTFFRPFGAAPPDRFLEEFRSLAEDSLARRGWIVVRKEPAYWARRGITPGVLTLYTLRGDNWPDSPQTPYIQNLCVRRISAECFTAEVHLMNFVPVLNWQQAGIIILEDTAFNRRAVRLSLAYNDFGGGFNAPREILVQAITSLGQGSQNPEEAAHTTVNTIDAGKEKMVSDDLRYSALRIEKRGRMIRFLYAAGPMENSAFREVASREFPMVPEYVGIFALKGFVDDTVVAPVVFRSFSVTVTPCGK